MRNLIITIIIIFSANVYALADNDKNKDKKDNKRPAVSAMAPYAMNTIINGQILSEGEWESEDEVIEYVEAKDTKKD